MHPNLAFRKPSHAQNLDFAQERGFGILSINGENGPIASHIPFVLSADKTIIDAHLVRSNPIVSTLGKAAHSPAVLMVSGPDGYISPDWYEIEDQVPTWNYVAVHLRGRLELRAKDTLKDHLTELSHQFEQRLQPKPEWLLDKVNDAALERLMHMIVPVRLQIETVEGTWKLSQNKDDQARLRASGAVEGGTGQELLALAGLMRDIAD
ncbi:MAG: FMN-binding negative transcriptional regulator [Alphaproteobacteria bacterium]|nr:FMN-binding negative transcriptional regulator [Alphaproteobacteria bacterium]